MDGKQLYMIHYGLIDRNEKKDVPFFYFGIQDLEISKKDANSSHYTICR